MAERATISLDEEAYTFLDQAAGNNKSAYINSLLKQEKRRVIEEAVLRANEEEGRDQTYQDCLSEWDAALYDGLGT